MCAYGVNTEANASTILKYNLQFFAEGGDDGDDGNSPDNDGNPSDGDNTSSIDPAAFAEIISDKDKKLEEMQEQISKLQKSNAELLVRVNAGTKVTQEKTFEENLIALNGWKPRKE